MFETLIQRLKYALFKQPAIYADKTTANMASTNKVKVTYGYIVTARIRYRP